MNTWADGNSRSWEPVPDVIGDDHAFLQILRAAREVSVELRNSIIYNRSYSLARIRSLVEHVEQALVFARTSDAYSDVRRVDDLTRHLLKRLVDPGQFPAKGKTTPLPFLMRMSLPSSGISWTSSARSTSVCCGPIW